METPLRPPLVFACRTRDVFPEEYPDEDITSLCKDGTSLGENEPPVNPGSNEPEGEKS